MRAVLLVLPVAVCVFRLACFPRGLSSLLTFVDVDLVFHVFCLHVLDACIYVERKCILWTSVVDDFGMMDSMMS